MKNVKKILAVILALALVFAFAACTASDNGTTTASPEGTSASAEGKTFKVGVIQYVSHPSLDNCYAGIEKALKEDKANTYEIDRQIGSDSAPDSDCATFAANMVAAKYDMIFAIATPAATAAYAATEGTEIPVIFSAVSDPEAAKLVEKNDAPGGLCTGTSDVLDFDAQVNLIKAMQPDVKTIGVLYTSSEANSISQLGSFTEVCEKNGIKVESTAIQNDADIPSAAEALCSKVDCLNNFTDNKVVNNLSVVLEAANEAKIPVYGSEEEQVKNGCLASVSIDYVALGEVTGNMGIEVLGGADCATMAVKTISDATPVVNTEVLEALSYEMPADFSDAATVTTNK